MNLFSKRIVFGMILDMKKIINLLLIIFMLGFMPLSVVAEGEETATPEGEKPPEAQAAQAVASASAEAEENGIKVQINAQAAALIDRSSGKVLYEVNGDAKYDPTSLVKIMTVYLAENALTPSQTLSMSETAFNTYDHSAGVLWIQIDEMLTAESAEYATMLASSNDTAAMLVEAVTLNQDDFVAQMNAQATTWGLTNTKFTNVFGISDGEQYSTAIDIATMTRQAMKDESFSELFGASSYTIPATNRQTQTRPIANDCKLLRNGETYYNEEVTGGKIGGTSETGFSLVASSERGGTSIIAVVMGEESAASAYEDINALLEYGFSQYQTVKITVDQIGEKTVEVINEDGKHSADVTFYVEKGFEALLPSEIDASNLEVTIEVENEDATNAETMNANVVFSINGTTVGTSKMQKTIVEYDTSFEATTLPLIQQGFDYFSIFILAFILFFPIIVKWFTSLTPPE